MTTCPLSGRGQGHVTHSGISHPLKYRSLERLKLESSNFVCLQAVSNVSLRNARGLRRQRVWGVSRRCPFPRCVPSPEIFLLCRTASLCLGFALCVMTQQNATFWGLCTPAGGYDPQIRTRPRFLCNAPIPQVSFHHPMFTRLEVIVLTHQQNPHTPTSKQTPPKRSNVLRYATMLGNDQYTLFISSNGARPRCLWRLVKLAHAVLIDPLKALCRLELFSIL